MAIVTLVVSVLGFCVSQFLYHRFDGKYVLQDSDESIPEVAINIGAFASEAAAASFYLFSTVVIFWLLSLAIDKLDEIIWLNASDEDKNHIIMKRTNNAKNQ